MIKVSIIIPVLNDYHALSELLLPINLLQRDDIETIVVDGGSIDGSVMLAKQFADEVIEMSAGRAIQQNAGAEIAKGNSLWFLHADSIIEFSQLSAYLTTINNNKWGRFKVIIDSISPIYSLIGFLINLRSRITGIATGDQGIFVEKHLFNEVCGFGNKELMEDIDISIKLKKISAPHYAAKLKIITSARRWQKNGVIKTILLMWKLRLWHFLKVPTEKIAKQYNQSKAR